MPELTPTDVPGVFQCDNALPNGAAIGTVCLDRSSGILWARLATGWVVVSKDPKLIPAPKQEKPEPPKVVPYERKFG